jgi:hypothetical protein
MSELSYSQIFLEKWLNNKVNKLTHYIQYNINICDICKIKRSNKLYRYFDETDETTYGCFEYKENQDIHICESCENDEMISNYVANLART